MKHARKLGIIFFIVALLTSCAHNPATANTPTVQRKAVYDIAAALSAADKTTQSLFAQHLLTADEAVTVERFVREATVLDDTLNGCVDKMLSAQTDTPDAVAATACASDIVTQLRSKEAQTVAGIKNAESKAKINAALTLFDSGIALVTQAIGEFHK